MAFIDIKSITIKFIRWRGGGEGGGVPLHFHIKVLIFPLIVLTHRIIASRLCGRVLRRDDS